MGGLGHRVQSDRLPCGDVAVAWVAWKAGGLGTLWGGRGGGTLQTTALDPPAVGGHTGGHYPPEQWPVGELGLQRALGGCPTIGQGLLDFSTLPIPPPPLPPLSQLPLPTCATFHFRDSWNFVFGETVYN